jgi:MoxR-like ATPase
VLGAKARAAMSGRGVPNFDDVRAVAPSVLRHRLVTSFQAEADGRTGNDLVEELIQSSRKWT